MTTSILSLQLGAATAAPLFPVIGVAGTSLLRLAFAAIVLFGIFRPPLRRWTARQWSLIVIFGLDLGAMNGLFYGAVARLPLGVAVAVEFLGPLTLAALLGRRPRDLAWPALAAAGVTSLGFAGRATGGADPIGIALALAAGALWAGYVVLGARLAASNLGPGSLAAATAVGSLAVAPFAGGLTTDLLTPEVLVRGAVTGLLGSVLPYTCELLALGRLPRPAFSILLALEPAAGAAMGGLAMHQPLTGAQAAGIVLVCLAAVGSTAFSTAPAVTKSDQIRAV